MNAELTDIHCMYIQSCLMMAVHFHVHVVMVHDKRRLHESTAMIVQWKLVVCHHWATLNLCHDHK